MVAKEAISRLGVLLGFSQSPCMTCFVLLVIGLGPRFRVFSF
jgi:hypothetical protein